MTDVKPIPDGYPRVCAYLHIGGAAAAIDFYKDVFGATERLRMSEPDGKIGHAELQIGDSVVMLADEYPEMGIVGPKTVGGTPVGLSVFMEDVDATLAKAVAGGARVTRPIEDRFYGDRTVSFEDPFGHEWSVQTHIEDVSPEEIQRRAAQQADG
ncbi:MAG: VOC family protein [Streptosporangiaceae bacterium]